MNNNIETLIFIVIALIIFMSYNKQIKEAFYSYYPPSNCMETVFGKLVCYPPYYFPFYSSYW
jgi:hypothetical protein